MWRFVRPDALTVMKDMDAKTALPRYFAVMQDKKQAKFVISKRIPVHFGSGASLKDLWALHDYAISTFYSVQEEIDSGKKDLDEMPNPKTSLLDLKIEVTNRILESCKLCTRRCGINRIEENVGFCRCGSRISVSTMFEHFGEEPELAPSGTIFTLGCNLRCFHCQNWTISQWHDAGETYKPQRLALAIEHLRKNGCRNANLVGGEPTPWLHQWLETFRHVEINTPIIWNSNSYYSRETANLLAGFTDVYLLDFKYGSNECAKRISDAPKYWESSIRNHLLAKKYGEIIIRVLVLPGHLECCTKQILNWIARRLGTDTRTNIMFQYRPEWKAHELEELGRRLTTEEMQRAIDLAKEYGLRNFIT